ncbi:MAG TPA: glycosyltransferase [Candidatus Binatus sp.]|nr:glycosyltransferase [Candidatus Binatus sp.]
MSERICFLGGARYRQPLDVTDRKKFAAMNTLGEIYVIGFAHGLRPRVFTEHGHFYLLPQLPLRILRYLEIWIGGTLLMAWLILRHGIRLIVVQGPYEGVGAAALKKIIGWFGLQIFLVVEVHGDFETSVFLERRVRFTDAYRFLMSRAARFSFHQADVLRAISKSTQSQVRRWAPDKAIVQFPAWTDIETFCLAANAAGERDSERILYAGVLTPLKGVDRLIDAFALIAGDFPQSRLAIVGRRQNQEYGERLGEQVARLNLVDRIEFMPAVAQAELAVLMATAAVLVLPSNSEGLGRVLVEAMAAATPVIGTDVGGIPDLIKNGVNGFLVPPGDPAALAQRLRWILTNPRQAVAMGQAGQTFATEFFSTEVYLNGYRNIFQRARNGGATRHHAIANF